MLVKIQMSKALFILSLIFILIGSACSNVAPSTPEIQPSTRQTAIDKEAPPLTESVPSVAASATVEATAVVEQTVSIPSGLQIVYLREGNLWSWTGTNDNVMLTGTGDMSTARLSGDGQLLAFMRGNEVWTIRMDGTEARPLVIQEHEGGALWFAPNNSLLAVSTPDHIDIIDLNNATTTTVLTYPAIPNGYYPEVVWSSDSVGFKTVIPPSSENDQAKFLFIMTDGTEARLANFSMIPPPKSLPFISPDGGYVIYTAKLPEEKNSLFIMDSSGATRPYGEPADNVRAFGWLPDSKHFSYISGNQEQIQIGSAVADSPTETDVRGFETVRWLDAEQFLGIQDNNLYAGEIIGGKILIAENVTGFDFIDVHQN